MTQQYPPQQPPGGGAQPPPQPQYGQQPPPPPQPPYGQPVGQGMPGQAPGYPQAPNKMSKNKVILIVAAAVVVLGVVALITWQNSKTAPSSAGPGDCIKVNSASEKSADVEKIDCASPDALYKVGTKMDGTDGACPTDSYIPYTQTGSKEFKLCLILNAKEGTCYGNVTSPTGPTAADCASPQAQAKTSKVVNGQASKDACPDADGLALVYPEPSPGETICLVRAGAGQGA